MFYSCFDGVGVSRFATDLIWMYSIVKGEEEFLGLDLR